MKKPARKSVPPPAVRPSPPPGRAADLAVLAVIALLSIAAYVNTLHGEFVYDDSHQIVDNSFIQDPRLLWKGLTSDVWGYKGDKPQAWSNYWRPMFILWVAMNHRLFGLTSTVGWHATNILLHVGVGLVAYGLLRQLRVGRLTAAAILAVFAVHPAHVETVAWISGSTDMLLTLPLLAALWCILSLQERPAAWKWGAAIALYAVTTMTKEASVLFPAIAFAAVFFTRFSRSRDASTNSESELPLVGPASRRSGHDLRSVSNPLADSFKRALLTAIPFVCVAAVYLATRHSILKIASIKVPWALSPAGLLTTAPSIIAFYMRQVIFPLWIGPSYPLRATVPQDVGPLNFFLPVLIIITVAAVFAWLSRRDPVRQLGLVLFFVPIAPATYVNAFTPEQLVHDRYLYLPLLGALMVLIPTARDLLERFRRMSRDRAERAVLIAASVCCVPLAVQTIRYNTAWMSELSLWAWGIESDPTSATNHAQYGSFLKKAGRIEEAKRELDLSIRLRPANAPLTDALFNRATIAIREGRIPDAERDLRLILSHFPDFYQAHQKLAEAYVSQGRFEDALALLREGRKAVPFMQCTFTDNLAVVLYQAGRKDEALRELEAYESLVPKEYGAPARALLFHLGSLYVELGRTADARRVLQQYLDETALFEAADPEVRKLRQSARQQIAQPTGGPGHP